MFCVALPRKSHVIRAVTVITQSQLKTWESVFSPRFSKVTDVIHVQICQNIILFLIKNFTSRPLRQLTTRLLKYYPNVICLLYRIKRKFPIKLSNRPLRFLFLHLPKPIYLPFLYRLPPRPTPIVGNLHFHLPLHITHTKHLHDLLTPTLFIPNQMIHLILIIHIF